MSKPLCSSQPISSSASLPQFSSFQPIVDHAKFYDANTHIPSNELSVLHVHDIQRVTDIVPSSNVIHPSPDNVSLPVVSSSVHSGAHCVPDNTNSH